jgi:hypothetical protein
LGTGGQEITGNCRKVHNEDLHRLYSSQNITGVTKIERDEKGGGMWHVEKCIQNFGGKYLRERDQFEDVGADGRIILK